MPTKLVQWLSGAVVFMSLWAFLLSQPFNIPGDYIDIIWASPIYLLMSFACYSLAVIGYRVATFNDCPGAALELKQQILEAKSDLSKKGLKIQ